MTIIKANPTEFAAAYIQTLPHAKKEEEFESRQKFAEYLKLRQETYFKEFMRAAVYANDEFQEYILEDDEEDK